MKHNSVAPLRSIPPIRRIFSAISVALSFVFALATFGVSVNTSWTYQGQLRRSGSAYSGTCNFQFSLWDAVSAGTQQGSTQAINSVNVVNGLFTVVLDFGDVFTGDARWLGTSVQCSGDGGFTPLDPRQPLTAAPYALSLQPGATIKTGGAQALYLYQWTDPNIGAAVYAQKARQRRRIWPQHEWQRCVWPGDRDKQRRRARHQQHRPGPFGEAAQGLARPFTARIPAPAWPDDSSDQST